MHNGRHFLFLFSSFHLFPFGFWRYLILSYEASVGFLFALTCSRFCFSCLGTHLFVLAMSCFLYHESVALLSSSSFRIGWQGFLPIFVPSSGAKTPAARSSFLSSDFFRGCREQKLVGRFYTPRFFWHGKKQLFWSLIPTRPGGLVSSVLGYGICIRDLFGSLTGGLFLEFQFLHYPQHARDWSHNPFVMTISVLHEHLAATCCLVSLPDAIP